IMAAGAPASLLMGAQRSYLAAMGHPKQVMAVAVGALIVNALLNYGLIYGAWGLPEMGYLGSATATAITLWLMLAAMTLGMNLSADTRAHRLFGPLHARDIRELAHLGWPIAVTMGV